MWRPSARTKARTSMALPLPCSLNLASATAVTAAALVRTEGINGAQRVPERGDVIGGLVSDPASKGFRHRAAQDRCRPDLDTLAVGKQHGIEPDHIAAAAVTGADEPRQQLDSGDCRQPLITIAQCAGDIRGIETGACRLVKRVRLRREWRPRSRQRNVFDRPGRRPEGFFQSRWLALLRL